MPSSFNSVCQILVLILSTMLALLTSPKIMMTDILEIVFPRLYNGSVPVYGVLHSNVSNVSDASVSSCVEVRLSGPWGLSSVLLFGDSRTTHFSVILVPIRAFLFLQ